MNQYPSSHQTQPQLWKYICGQNCWLVPEKPLKALPQNKKQRDFWKLTFWGYHWGGRLTLAKGNTSYTSYHISSSILLQDDSHLQMSDSNVGDEMEDFTGLLFCLFSFTLKICYQKSYIFLSLFLSLTQISPVLSQYSNQPTDFHCKSMGWCLYNDNTSNNAL